MEYRQHVFMDVFLHSDYFKHVSAMTKEELHSKAEIAEELAVRDMRIKELEAKLVAMTQERDELRKVLGFVLSNPSEEAYWLTQLQAVMGAKK